VSGECQGDERKQTTDEVSKGKGRRQNRGTVYTPGAVQGKPADRLDGVRHKGGVNLIRALMRNVGTRVLMPRENLKWMTHERESTEARPRGGTTRSSGEVSVMEMERRGEYRLLKLTDQPARGGIGEPSKAV
jgi:hypothetical protein